MTQFTECADPGARQVVLDTETTGLSPNDGHRVIEIGMVELENLHLTGRSYQVYLDPERDIPHDSIRIHGITNERVAGCPKFAEVAADFRAFIGDSPMVIHNASFDLGFLNHELRLCQQPTLDGQPVVDTLLEARRRHPRQRNSLDALCRRYDVDNSERTVHGALLDAQILAAVYVAMQGGHQTMLHGMAERWGGEVAAEKAARTLPPRAASDAPTHLLPTHMTLPENRRTILATASDEELAAHRDLLARLGDACIWRDAEPA